MSGGRARPAGSRDVALAALARVDEGAYANLVLPPLLRRSGLPPSDRAAVSDLVDGSLRLRAALDFALAPLSRQPLDRLEALSGVPVRYVSVGTRRDQIIEV